jgi:uncharacterized membrane protein
LVRIEKSIEIRAPPEKVWEMLAFDRLLEWLEGFKGQLKSVEYTSEVHSLKDKFRVGASAHGRPHEKGEVYFEVTASLENKKLTYRLYGKICGLGTYILEPVDNGTKLTLVKDYERPSGIFGKVLEPLFLGKAREKEFERDLRNLKSILEK